MELLMTFQLLLPVFQTFVFLMFLGEAYALNEHGPISLIHGQSFNFILGTNATSAETSSLYVFRGLLHLMLTWDDVIMQLCKAMAIHFHCIAVSIKILKRSENRTHPYQNPLEDLSVNSTIVHVLLDTYHRCIVYGLY